MNPVYVALRDEKNIRLMTTVTFNKTIKRVVTSWYSKDGVYFTQLDCMKNTYLEANTIHDKARQLHGKFADDGDNNADDLQQSTSMASPTKQIKFITSKGCFDKFQNTFNTNIVSLHGEAASTDKPTARDF